MRKLIVVLMSFILLTVISPAGWVLGQEKTSTGAVTYSETEDTSYSRAVFAHYLAVIPNTEYPDLNVDCAISISNVCAVPEGSSLDKFLGAGDDAEKDGYGGFAIILYDRDGTVHYFSSRENEYPLAGYGWAGLNPDGTLGPGQTFTANLKEVLASIRGVQPRDIESFVGYGWVLSEFDCLAGTYSNTIYGLGFTQAFELKPAMGQGGWIGGLPLPVD